MVGVWSLSQGKDNATERAGCGLEQQVSSGMMGNNEKLLPLPQL